MEPLLLVLAVLASATFVTGLLLPVLARRPHDQDDRAREEALLRAELGAIR